MCSLGQGHQVESHLSSRACSSYTLFVECPYSPFPQPFSYLWASFCWSCSIHLFWVRPHAPQW